MTKEQLFDSLQYLDDDLLTERGEAKPRGKVWLRRGVAAAAACLVLIVGAVLAYPRWMQTWIQGQQSAEKTIQVQQCGPAVTAEQPAPTALIGQTAQGEPQPGGVSGPQADTEPKPTTLAWTDVKADSFRDETANYTPGDEELTAEQLKACMPEILVPWMDDWSGAAHYSLWRDSSTLLFVELTVSNSGWDGHISVYLHSKGGVYPTYVFSDADHVKKASLNGLEYRAYRWTPVWAGQEEYTLLKLLFEIDDVEYAVYTVAPAANAEQAELDLMQLLLCYAGTHNAPDLSGFRYGGNQ